MMDYINLTGMKPNDMETILLATSALPGIFGPVRFGKVCILMEALKIMCLSVLYIMQVTEIFW